MPPVRTRRPYARLGTHLLVGFGVVALSLLAASFASARTQAKATAAGGIRWAAPALGAGPLVPLAALAPPTKPTIIAPITQSPATVVGTANPTLEVSSTATEPISYQFQVATDSAFTNIVCQSGWLPTTSSWTLPDGCVKNDPTLNPSVGDGGPGGLWYWRAQAEDADGPSSWTSAQNFKVYVNLFGSGANWAMWNHGPLAVNLGTGNLVVNAPGPSFASVGGSLGVSLTYNEDDSTNNGLGAGWQVNAVPGVGSPPSAVVDHQNLTGSAKLDAAEVQYPGGTSQWFHHIDGTDTFVPTHNATNSVLTQNTDNSWTLTDSDGSVYQFNVENANGKATLKSVDFAQDRVNNGSSVAQVNYVFSTTDPTKLDHIIDVSGRKITLVWHSLDPAACGTPHLLCITLYDADGTELTTWLYDGDSDGRLYKVSDTAPDGTERALFQYTYNSPTGTRINKIQNANDLDSADASPGYNSSHSIQISYTQDTTSTLYDVTTVSDGPIFTQPSGKQTSTWTFQYLRGVATAATRDNHAGISAGTVRTAPRETKITLPNQQGAQSPATINYFIDSLDHPMEIQDALGNYSEFGYDVDETGNLEWSEDQAGNPTDNTWDPVNHVLLQTQAPDAGGGLGRPTTTYRYDEMTIGTASTPGTPLQGLQGWYFANQNLTGTPVKETDPNVDYTWGTSGPPALNGQGTNYSVQWIGDINLPSTGDYTFTGIANGGLRFHVDQIHAFHNWVDHGTLQTLSSQPINLTAGEHTIMLDYFKGTSGSAEVHLHWSCSDCSPAITDQVVPQSALLPAWNNQTSVVSPGGKVSFSHFASPWTSLPDYTLEQDSGTNYITSYTYDQYGRVTQKVMPKGNAAVTIDSNGNLVGTPDTTYAATYTYYGVADTAAATACGSGTAHNQAGQLESKQPHGVTATTYVYDAFGSVLQMSDAAGTTCNTYTTHEDRPNTSKAPGETLGLTYTYDPIGNALQVVGDGGVVISYYDEANRAATLDDNYVNNFGPTASYTYDQDGNLITRVAKTGTTQSSNTTNFTYNGGDQLTSVTDPAGKVYKFYYDALGNLHATQYPNATFSWTDRNADQWISALYNRHGTLPATLPPTVPADSQSSPIVDFAYTYNVDGERTQEQRTGGGLTAETTNYTYDNLGRLSTVVLPDGTDRVYGYDLDSNRSQIVENGTTLTTYTYDPTNSSSPGLDELTSVVGSGGSSSYAYTGDGQVSSRGSDTITWDGRGRLSGGTFGGVSVSYTFDPTGFRRQRVAGSTTTWYALQGMFQGNTSTISDSTLTNTDVGGPSGALAHYAGLPRSGTTVSYQYYNGHGDVAAEADSSGNRTAAYTYDPFGYLREGSAPSNSTSTRWLGRWHKLYDSQANLIEMGDRTYDPTLGRFYSVDPVDGGSFNNYDYADQDPINKYDLDGRICTIPFTNIDPCQALLDKIESLLNDAKCVIFNCPLIKWLFKEGAKANRAFAKWLSAHISEVIDFLSRADTCEAAVEIGLPLAAGALAFGQVELFIGIGATASFQCLYAAEHGP